jgi:hypothetical protein
MIPQQKKSKGYKKFLLGSGHKEIGDDPLDDRKFDDDGNSDD